MEAVITQSGKVPSGNGIILRDGFLLEILAQRGGVFSVHLPEGDHNVPWEQLFVSVEIVSRVVLGGRAFYPARFLDRRRLGSTLLTQGVGEVLHRNEDPLVLVDDDSDENPHAVAVFFAPREPEPKRGT